ncbi:MAG: UDP-glucose/iron transport system permease protein [Clostridiales bacterium]|nr:UDP-glucose/iron transport system permease protein [Clostridiales bacterium]
MNQILSLSIYQLLFSYFFVLLVFLILRWRGIPREKELFLSSIRMTLQLILTGYILLYLFDNPSPALTLVFLLCMELFAIYTIIKRAKTKLSKKLIQVIVVSMASGTLTCLLYFLYAVVWISPWYDPRYVIPLAGMLIGNSMTGISLGVNQLVGGMQTERDFVEGALMLGATPKMAAKHIVDHAFDAAILPTINSMLGMGIVFLPGMMTGQILSGASPLLAIKYQIAIMFGILGSVSLTVILFLELGYRTFFQNQNQLQDL